MRLNLHARIEIAIVAILLLGSCGENVPHLLTDKDGDFLEQGIDLNTRRIFQIDGRIDRVEVRLEKIEARLGK